MSRSIKMKIELDDDCFDKLKDNLMIAFLKDDKDTVEWALNNGYQHLDDIEYNKKLFKAYKRILKYYGVTND